MKCKNCGYVFDEHGKFCPACGSPVEKIASDKSESNTEKKENSVEIPVPNSAPIVQRKSKKKKYYIWLVVLCLGVGMWMSEKESGSPNKQDQEETTASVSETGIEREIMETEAEMDSSADTMDSLEETESIAEYILPNSNSVYLTESDLMGLDKGLLRLARNEIYARHGRIFSSDDLNEYFNSLSWYFGTTPAEGFNESVFNEYEKANLELIKQVEANADDSGSTIQDITSGLYINETQEITLSISMYSSPENDMIGSIEEDYGFGYAHFEIVDNGTNLYGIVDDMGQYCGELSVIDGLTINFDLWGEPEKYTCIEIYHGN